MRHPNLAWTAEHPVTRRVLGLGETIQLAFDDAQRRGSQAERKQHLNYFPLRNQRAVAIVRRELDAGR